MATEKLNDERLHNCMQKIYKWGVRNIREGQEVDGNIAYDLLGIKLNVIGGGSDFNDLEYCEFIEISDNWFNEYDENVDEIRILEKGMQYCSEYFGYEPLQVENIVIYAGMFYLYNHVADMVKRGKASTIEEQEIHQEEIAEWVLLDDEGLVFQIDTVTDGFDIHGVFQLTDFGIQYCKKYFGYDPKKLKKIQPRSIRQYHKMEMYKPFIQRMLDGDLFGSVYRDFEIMLEQRGKRPGSIAAYKANLTRRYEMAAQQAG